MTLRLELGTPLPDEWRSEARETRDRLRRRVEELAKAPPGFIEILEQGDGEAERCRVAAERLAKFDRIALLGIGGSALGPRVVRDALAPDHAERLIVIDNIDPDTIDRARARLDPRRTGFLVVSKSGSTAETAAQLLYFSEWLRAAGVDPAKSILLITDPAAGPLRALAARDGYATLDVPPRVGGRFSVLTAVGLLPAALLGIDPAELLSGGRALWRAVRDHADHPLLDWVTAHALRAERSGERIQVLMAYSDRLRTFCDWFAQLWGESLGKRLDRTGQVVHRGSTPLAALGATDQHSLVQLFVEGPADKQYMILGIDPSSAPRAPLPAGEGTLHPDFAYLGGRSIDELFAAERSGTARALVAAGRPVARLQLARLDAQTLGALFVFFELATVLAAECLDVNPYDQPGVELGKWIAFARMGRAGFAERVRGAVGSFDEGEDLPGLPLL